MKNKTLLWVIIQENQNGWEKPKWNVLIFGVYLEGWLVFSKVFSSFLCLIVMTMGSIE